VNDRVSECNNNAVLDNRVTNLEKGFDRVSAAVESIAESLTTLTRLEAHHEETRAGVTRAFQAIEKCERNIDALEDSRVKKTDCDNCHNALKSVADKQDTRISNIETEMPTLKLVRGWVIAGVVGIIGILCVAIMSLVLT
jgi:hypothetical protein